ncbi:MAG: glutaredoxin 3 [Pseudomonadota bacterium]
MAEAQTTPVVLYTTPICPFCIRAKRLLDSKGVSYTEINVMGDSTARAEMLERSGGARTVPQIFIGGTHIGGSDDLMALDARGGVEPLLAAG